MIFLGLLLVLLAGAAIVLIATEESARYVLFGVTFEPNHIEMFLAGAATAAVLLAGIWLITLASRRSALRRRQLRSVRADASDRVAKLEEEKQELERKLEHERTTDDQLVAGRQEKTPR
jgi:ABC-type nickel/cobalt efflux system permease component RcnA